MVAGERREARMPSSSGQFFGPFSFLSANVWGSGKEVRTQGTAALLGQ